MGQEISVREGQTTALRSTLSDISLIQFHCTIFASWFLCFLGTQRFRLTFLEHLTRTQNSKQTASWGLSSAEQVVQALTLSRLLQDELREKIPQDRLEA